MSTKTKILSVAVALVVLGCEQLPPAPNAILSNWSSVTSALSAAKQNSETLVQHAKTHFRPFRMSEGKLLYGKAKAAHNSAITKLSLALWEEPTQTSYAEIRQKLFDADQKRKAFYDWYSASFGQRRRTAPGTGSSQTSIADSFVEIAQIISDWYLTVEQLNQTQRQQIHDELEKCEWRPWNEL